MTWFGTTTLLIHCWDGFAVYNVLLTIKAQYTLCSQAIVWDIRRCALQTRLEGHQGGVFGVDLDQKSRTAFTASGDKVTSHTVYMLWCV